MGVELRSPAGTWWLSSDALWLAPRDGEIAALRLIPEGTGGGGARLSALAEQPARVNYLLGRDPAAWHTGVPTFAALAWTGAYPGLDLELRADAAGLALIVLRGDPARLRLHFDTAGRACASAPGACAGLPRAYSAGGALCPQVTGDVLRFSACTPADAAAQAAAGHLPPASLFYGTYLGGNDDENYSTNEIGGIVANGSGQAYVAGGTCSPDFPLAGSLQGYIAPRCFAFVTRITVEGDRMLYSTLYGTTGGGGDTHAAALDLVDDNNVILAGGTHAPDLLTLNPAQGTYGGLGDAYVTRLSVVPRFCAYLPISAS